MTEARRPAAAVPSGDPRSALPILIVLVAVVAAACGNSSPPRSQAPARSAASSSSPAASGPPTPSPRADPATAAIKAFVALVTTDGFSYQATFTGQDRHTTDVLPITRGLLQVSGDDALVRATFAFPGRRYVVEQRYVDGKGWIRYDTGDAWRRLTMHTADSMAAFAAIRTIADVTYLGPVTSGGKTVYQVAFRSAIVNPVMIPARNLTETVLTSPKLTLLIDASGRPIKGTAEIDGHGRVSGQLQEIVIDLTVTFTKFGEAVSIKAP